MNILSAIEYETDFSYTEWLKQYVNKFDLETEFLDLGFFCLIDLEVFE